MTTRMILFASLFVLSACGFDSSSDQGPTIEAPQSYLTYVDPFIGTDAHGHTYPGATLPFGMVQLSPDTRLEGWDGCSGYHYSDREVYGFSHTHLSGTGVSDYGDILLMPTTGAFRWQNGAQGTSGYKSSFQKEREEASPGYYGVFLDDYQIQVDLTATTRTGLHQYTLEEGERLNVMLDLGHRDQVIKGGVRIVNQQEIEGYRISTAWAEEQHVYFSIRFSEPFTEARTQKGALKIGETLEGDSLLLGFSFAVPEKRLLAQVAISPVDQRGAKQNLDDEFANWDFAFTRKKAEEIWENQLSKIRLKNTSEDVLTNFYTALYHSFIAPNTYIDTDGRYRGTDLKVHTAETGHYTVFSLWDTYRATHPLLNILEPERTQEFIQTFLRQYQEGGRLPMWELAANYTGCMIGYHAVPVIYDAYQKGLRDFDAALALEAMVASAEANELGKPYYREWGFITAEVEPESVSKTLEYAYNDWCIAQMAKALGEENLYQRFLRRAQSYKNILHPEEGFMVSKTAHRWCDPFDPTEVNFHYTEANSWQYSLYVPHDVEGLIHYLGGPDSLEAYLDALFTSSSETTGREQADITGLIGQYAHGNEPSHHMAYLYNYIGKPWKTQARVHEILTELYQPQPDGLPGNEDCGQMSSWYVFSALGLYPVCPGSPDYVIGKPLVGEAIIPLASGDTLRILADAPNKRYVKQVLWNGEPYPNSYISYEQLMQGGTLEFIMVNRPMPGWATEEAHWPSSRISEHLIVPVPGIASGGRAFFGSDTLRLNHLDPQARIYYTLDGRRPDSSSNQYKEPILLTETTEMKAVAWLPELGYSKVIQATFQKVPNDRSIQLLTQYSNQYAAGGDRALIDYLKGGQDYRTGEWQGYHGVNLEAVVDLGQRQTVKEINIRFLQDHNSWIFMPETVQFYESRNGRDFNLLITKPTQTDERQEGSIVEEFSIPLGLKTRYIKVVGKNRGVCPPWHKGTGGKAWVFADEIEILSN